MEKKPPIGFSGAAAKIRAAVDGQRLLDTAVALVEVPSPTRDAGEVADRLAELLTEDGFQVERPVADWPKAPAVAVRLQGRSPGKVLQFDGHLDTVHLPFVPPRVAGGKLYGSGSSDMKGGIAACVEALRVLRDTECLAAGSVLLTAHDHHEAPWGDRRQVRALIADGYVGDAVLLPEYLAGHLPVEGRGMGIFEVTISREGEPVHEVLRPENQPNVVDAGAELVVRLRQLDVSLGAVTSPHAGRDSVFVGKVQAGEIYNQSPTQCTVHGTRRWVTPGGVEAARSELDQLFREVAESSETTLEWEFEVPGDAFRLDPEAPVAAAFQRACRQISGAELPLGGKPFVDDGNVYSTLAGIPALTHGPDATGAHTLEEAVPVAELVRVAQVYALTAVAYGPGESGTIS